MKKFIEGNEVLNQFQVPLNKLNFISIDTVSIRIDVEVQHLLYDCPFRYFYKKKSFFFS